MTSTKRGGADLSEAAVPFRSPAQHDTRRQALADPNLPKDPTRLQLDIQSNAADLVVEVCIAPLWPKFQLLQSSESFAFYLVPIKRFRSNPARTNLIAALTCARRRIKDSDGQLEL
jgi:hypothetical protein